MAAESTGPGSSNIYASASSSRTGRRRSRRTRPTRTLRDVSLQPTLTTEQFFLESGEPENHEDRARFFQTWKPPTVRDDERWSRLITLRKKYMPPMHVIKEAGKHGKAAKDKILEVPRIKAEKDLMNEEYRKKQQANFIRKVNTRVKQLRKQPKKAPLLHVYDGAVLTPVQFGGFLKWLRKNEGVVDKMAEKHTGDKIDKIYSRVALQYKKAIADGSTKHIEDLKKRRDKARDNWAKTPNLRSADPRTLVPQPAGDIKEEGLKQAKAYIAPEFDDRVIPDPVRIGLSEAEGALLKRLLDK